MDFNPTKLQELLKLDLDPYVISAKKRRLALALRASILKKYVDHDGTEFHSAAASHFVEVNRRVATISLDPAFISSRVFHYWKERIRMLFTDPFYGTSELSLHSCCESGSVGPGASIGSDENDFVTKMFHSPLTCTNMRLYEHYKRVTSHRWKQAESIRFARFGVRQVSGSKFASVPKDATKNRNIAIEPVLNMFYQLGAKANINALLKSRMSLDIPRQQAINRAMAKHGSVFGDLATLDLKDASDMISLTLCEALLPHDVYLLLMKIRSGYINVDGTEHKLEMIGTMGNGFTFSLMTSILATLIQAVYDVNGLKPENGRNFAVYGDDMIVVTKYYQQVVDVLQSAGLVVNLNKSFHTGPFRESCGGDYYHGQNVRGVYIKEKPTNDQAIYATFNRLFRWALNNDVNIVRTLRYLKGLAKFQPVPMDSPDDSGFKITASHLTSPKRDKNGSILYHGSVPIEYGVRIDDHFTNLPGVLIGFLGGYVRNNFVSWRAHKVKYTRVRNTCPNWDYVCSYTSFRSLAAHGLWARILMRV